MDIKRTAVVFDSCALIAYLEGEEGADTVEALLIGEETTCVAHAVNLTEVYKFYLKHRTASHADESIKTITEEMDITPRRDMSEVFWKSVAHIWTTITTTKNPASKGCHHIAMADCFALALAKRTRGTVVTSDSQFQPAADAGICRVSFYRSPGLRYDH